MHKIQTILLNVRTRFHKYSNINSKYKFINRLRGNEKYLIILAGYKKYLYSYVFSRLEKFLPEDIDVCIVSSGMFDETLCSIAEKNHWSYLSIEKNKIEVAQNIAIQLNQNAKYIYKMDEDIFVTKGCFEKIFDTYKEIKQNGKTDVGLVAPIIPLNGFGFMKILDQYDLVNKYSDMFGKPIYSSRNEMAVLSKPEAARFFWGANGVVPNIDQMNKDFAIQPYKYSLCSIRFSIGFILFERSLWDTMGMFHQTLGSGIGNDETQICGFCINESKPIVVSENCVVGHFSFGPQTKSMIEFLDSSEMEYYRNN